MATARIDSPAKVINGTYGSQWGGIITLHITHLNSTHLLEAAELGFRLVGVDAMGDEVMMHFEGLRD